MDRMHFYWCARREKQATKVREGVAPRTAAGVSRAVCAVDEEQSRRDRVETAADVQHHATAMQRMMAQMLATNLLGQLMLHRNHQTDKYSHSARLRTNHSSYHSW